MHVGTNLKLIVSIMPPYKPRNVIMNKLEEHVYIEIIF